MEGLFGLAAGAVTAAVCAVSVRRGAPELALLVGLAGAVWLLFQAMGSLSEVLALMEALTAAAGLSQSVVAPLVRTVAISLVTRLACEICKGAGEGAIATCLETAGTAAALVVALPLIREVLEMMTEMLL